MRKDTLLFISPALIIVLIFLVIPIFQSVYLSVLSDDGKFIGLQNYIDVFTDSHTISLSGFPKWPPLGALIHNFIWIAIHLPLTVFLGLFFALLLKGIKGATIVRTVIFMGMVVPMIVGGILVRFLFSQHAGMVSRFFRFIGIQGLDINWIAHPETALLALILTSVWLWTGYCLVVYMAALTTIPKSLYEASELDGASSWNQLWYITFPLLKPATGIIIIMTVIWESKLFDIVYSSTLGGPGRATSVMALEMYMTAFRYFEYGKGTAIATLLTMLTSVPIIFMVRSSMKS
ncbi:ABC transporter permease [candidate division KSB3 bacterium]|uniref:ABC transporter permease n=1 Tax=candidate division KSB3 bacterium TaxID=2044937 RepID=A0A2G6E6S2_9BACT|nr:MAG: ABC transporter permease [candidate division KSB3 bacterium]PIE30159.1 MAG: ABC transporter permease [candidate division KSB3 bacterium]